MTNSSRLALHEYKNGILSGDRVILARAITLMESALDEDQRLAGEVLDAVISYSGNSIRLGITGAPGVGKSTFIESFGKSLTIEGKKVAVLTIDPTSQLTGGSILGDKTRMAELARDAQAFIRPSPAGHTLGGVAAHTRESILLCEAAGFDTIIVETVGTGQSEVTVKNMVDFFLLLMQPGSGDELQGIKKGIVEMADAVVVTKADGDHLQKARASQADFQHALHLARAKPSGWTPKVLISSSIEHRGLKEIAAMLQQFKTQLSSSGYFHDNRRNQDLAWFKDHFYYLLSLDPKKFMQVAEAENKLEELIHAGRLSPRRAAFELLQSYHDAIKKRL